jgi:tetratricopeptide (TPR) repeat protein
VLSIREKALGTDHPLVGVTSNNLAQVYQAEKNYEKAEPLYKRSVEILEKSLGPDHPDVATALENYASLLRKTKRKAEAQRLEARAKAIRARQSQNGGPAPN